MPLLYWALWMLWIEGLFLRVLYIFCFNKLKPNCECCCYWQHWNSTTFELLQAAAVAAVLLPPCACEYLHYVCSYDAFVDHNGDDAVELQRYWVQLELGKRNLNVQTVAAITKAHPGWPEIVTYTQYWMDGRWWGGEHDWIWLHIFIVTVGSTLEGFSVIDC